MDYCNADNMILKNKEWPNHLSTFLQELWKTDCLCDVIIRGRNGQEFHAHSAVLGAASPILASMLSSRLNTKLVLESQVEDSVWSCLLQFIYKSQTRLGALQMAGLYATADALQISSIVDAGLFIAPENVPKAGEMDLGISISESSGCENSNPGESSDLNTTSAPALNIVNFIPNATLSTEHKPTSKETVADNLKETIENSESAPMLSESNNYETVGNELVVSSKMQPCSKKPDFSIDLNLVDSSSSQSNPGSREFISNKIVTPNKTQSSSGGQENNYSNHSTLSSLCLSGVDSIANTSDVPNETESHSDIKHCDINSNQNEDPSDLNSDVDLLANTSLTLSETESSQNCDKNTGYLASIPPDLDFIANTLVDPGETVSSLEMEKCYRKSGNGKSDLSKRNRGEIVESKSLTLPETKSRLRNQEYNRDTNHPTSSPFQTNLSINSFNDTSVASFAMDSGLNCGMPTISETDRISDCLGINTSATQCSGSIVNQEELRCSVLDSDTNDLTDRDARIMEVEGALNIELNIQPAVALAVSSACQNTVESQEQKTIQEKVNSRTNAVDLDESNFLAQNETSRQQVVEVQGSVILEISVTQPDSVIEESQNSEKASYELDGKEANRVISESDIPTVENVQEVSNSTKPESSGQVGIAEKFGLKNQEKTDIDTDKKYAKTNITQTKEQAESDHEKVDFRCVAVNPDELVNQSKNLKDRNEILLEIDAEKDRSSFLASNELNNEPAVALADSSACQNTVESQEQKKVDSHTNAVEFDESNLLAQNQTSRQQDVAEPFSAISQSGKVVEDSQERESVSDQPGFQCGLVVSDDSSFITQTKTVDVEEQKKTSGTQPDSVIEESQSSSKKASNELDGKEANRVVSESDIPTVKNVQEVSESTNPESSGQVAIAEKFGLKHQEKTGSKTERKDVKTNITQSEESQQVENDHEKIELCCDAVVSDELRSCSQENTSNKTLIEESKQREIDSDKVKMRSDFTNKIKSSYDSVNFDESSLKVPEQTSAVIDQSESTSVSQFDNIESNPDEAIAIPSDCPRVEWSKQPKISGVESRSVSSNTNTDKYRLSGQYTMEVDLLEQSSCANINEHELSDIVTYALSSLESPEVSDWELESSNHSSDVSEKRPTSCKRRRKYQMGRSGKSTRVKRLKLRPSYKRILTEISSRPHKCLKENSPLFRTSRCLFNELYMSYNKNVSKTGFVDISKETENYELKSPEVIGECNKENTVSPNEEVTKRVDKRSMKQTSRRLQLGTNVKLKSMKRCFGRPSGVGRKTRLGYITSCYRTFKKRRYRLKAIAAQWILDNQHLFKHSMKYSVRTLNLCGILVTRANKRSVGGIEHEHLLQAKKRLREESSDIDDDDDSYDVLNTNLDTGLESEKPASLMDEISVSNIPEIDLTVMRSCYVSLERCPIINVSESFLVKPKKQKQKKKAECKEKLKSKRRDSPKQVVKKKKGESIKKVSSKQVDKKKKVESKTKESQKQLQKKKQAKTNNFKSKKSSGEKTGKRPDDGKGKLKKSKSVEEINSKSRRGRKASRDRKSKTAAILQIKSKGRKNQLVSKQPTASLKSGGKRPVGRPPGVTKGQKNGSNKKEKSSKTSNGRPCSPDDDEDASRGNTDLCFICGQSVPTKSYRAHQLRHAEEKPFQCPMCPEKFRLFAKCQQHEQGHLQSKPFQCQFCRARFQLLSNCRLHERTHTDFGPDSQSDNSLLVAQGLGPMGMAQPQTTDFLSDSPVTCRTETNTNISRTNISDPIVIDRDTEIRPERMIITNHSTPRQNSLTSTSKRLQTRELEETGIIIESVEPPSKQVRWDSMDDINETTLPPVEIEIDRDVPLGVSAEIPVTLSPSPRRRRAYQSPLGAVSAIPQTSQNIPARVITSSVTQPSHTIPNRSSITPTRRINVETEEDDIQILDDYVDLT